MLTHLVGKTTKANTGKEVDGETYMLCILAGKHASKVVRHHRVFEPVLQHLQAKCAVDLLQQDFQKDTGRRCGIFFSENHIAKQGPRQGVTAEQMSKEIGNIPYARGLKAMNRGIL
jgi:hypothetical protein